MALALSFGSGPVWAVDGRSGGEDELPGTVEEAPVEQIVVVGLPARDHGVSGIHMDAETLAGIPGAHDDPLSALPTLPGVAVNNDFEGGAAVRGSRPVDNTYRVDFLDVGYLFHFGTGSVVDGELVDGFTFHAAGYGARFQNVIGGVVDAQTRDPGDRELEILLDVNLIHGGVLVEGPISENQRAYLSTRTSYYDLVMEPFLDEINESDGDDVDVVQLPRFWDYRGRYQIDLGERAQIDLLADGAMDDVALLYHDETTEALQDPVLAGPHRFGLEYHRQGLVYSRDEPDGGLRVRVGASRNSTDFSARLGGAGNADTLLTDNVLRIEVDAAVAPSHRLGWGVTLSHADIDYDVLLRDAGCTEFEVHCRFTDATPIGSADELTLRRSNAFIEESWTPTDSVTLVAGLTYGRDDYLEESRTEPRLAVVWRPFERTSLTLAGGGYHQLPAFEYIEKELGNPELSYLTAEHYALSFTHRFVSGWLVRADTYLKRSRNLVTADPFRRYDNRGLGTAKGVELLVRGHFGARLIGWLALSYSNSVRRDPDTGRTFDFEYDQPVIGSVVAKLLLHERLSLSGRAWFHSGPPHTRIVGGEPDPANPGGYLPVYGEINGERLPSYFRFDLRLDWTAAWSRDLRLYAEVLNATNHRNVSSYEYTEDYSSRKAVSQTPLFVSLGFRKRW